jgi:hypothetical protein
LEVALKQQSSGRSASDYLWLLLLAGGALSLLATQRWIPRTPEVRSILPYASLIVIFLVICAGIALFPNRFKGRHLLIVLLLFGFLSTVFPRMGYTVFHEVPVRGTGIFPDFYALLFTFLYPAIALSLSLAYRLGGGSSRNTFQIAVSSQIILFSGYLDLVWHLVNRVPYPDIMYNAHHIRVVIGHFPTPREALIFALAHIPLLIALLLFPFDRMGSLLSRLTGKGAREERLSTRAIEEGE